MYLVMELYEYCLFLVQVTMGVNGDDLQVCEKLFPSGDNEVHEYV